MWHAVRVRSSCSFKCKEPPRMGPLPQPVHGNFHEPPHSFHSVTLLRLPSDHRGERAVRSHSKLPFAIDLRRIRQLQRRLWQLWCRVRPIPSVFRLSTPALQLGLEQPSVRGRVFEPIRDVRSGPRLLWYSISLRSNPRRLPHRTQPVTDLHPAAVEQLSGSTPAAPSPHPELQWMGLLRLVAAKAT